MQTLYQLVIILALALPGEQGGCRRLGLFEIGREQARPHQQACHQTVRFGDRPRQATRLDQLAYRLVQMRRQCFAMPQLEEVDEKLDIHQAAPQQLGVKRPARLFVGRHFRAHFQGIVTQGITVPFAAKNGRHDVTDLLAGSVATDEHPGTRQRHVFPRPGILALIPRKTFHAYRQWSLIALGAQPGVHLVKRALRSRDTERCRHSLGKPVEIERRAERPLAIGFALVRTCKKIDDVEIRSVRQRTTPQPPEAHYHQFAASDASVL